MPKDFAKRTKKHNGASRFEKKKTRNPTPGWIWLVAGIVIGGLVSLGIYTQLPTPEVKPVTEKKNSIPSAKSRYQAVPAEKSSDSDFSFHNVLENKTVEVPEENTVLSTKGNAEKHYIMQCGSFRSKASAESLRALIAFNGFEANINATVEQSGDTWFRVSLGPYTSKRLAEQEKHQLEKNDINQCRIW